MKFDPLSWDEIAIGAAVAVGEGVVRIRATKEVALLVEVAGVEAMADHGTILEVEVSEDARVTVLGDPDTRAFIYVPPLTVSAPDDEVFTNIDRMPSESGAMAEVTRGLRLLEITRRNMLREIRAERIEFDAALAAGKKPPASDPALEAKAKADALAEVEGEPDAEVVEETKK